MIRPSGAEPKLKAYVSVTAGGSQEAIGYEKQIVRYIKKIL